MTTQDLKLQVSGLVTSPNPFGSAPEGSFALADNVVCRNAGILESRRGFKQHSVLSGGSRITSYQSHFVALANDTLNYYDGANWVAYTGTYNPPTGQPMRFAQAATDLLFTTDAGVFLLDAFNSTPRRSGIPRGYTIDSTQFGPPTLSTLGSVWFRTNSAVAYSVVFGKYTPTGTFLAGAPSPRTKVINNSGSDKAVSMNIYVDSETVDTSYFVQLYRTVSTIDASVDPGDQMFLAFERQLTATDFLFAGGYPAGIFIRDNTPEAALGAALYTDITQEGAGQANDRPPLAADIVVFKGTTVYANTVTPWATDIKLLGSPGGFNAGNNTSLRRQDTLTISTSAGSETYICGAAENIATRTFVGTGDQPSAVSSLARVINNATRVLNIRAFANNIDLTVIIEEAGVGGPALALAAGATPVTLAFNALTRASAGGPVTVTSPGQPYGVGDYVTLAGGQGGDITKFPPGIKQVTSVVAGFSWQYAEAGTIATSNSSSPPFTTTHTFPGNAWSPPAGVGSFPNPVDVAGLAYSKFNQPQAVPLENSDTVGDPASAVLRVVALRDSVLIYKQDGLYQLSGDDPSNFVLRPYDLTVNLFAPETAVALSDNVLGLTNQGVQVTGESSGASPISRQIEDALLSLMATDPTVAANAFAIPYQSEHQYLMWVPQPGGSIGFPYTLPISFVGTAGVGVAAYCLNVYTNTWSRYPLVAVHGMVDPVTNTLVLLDGGQVLQERKDFAASDYQDIGGTASISVITDSTHITMVGPGVGDLVTQGIYTSRVIANDGSGGLTLATPGTWALASATWATAIDCQWDWLPVSGQNPGTTKQFRETSLNFRSAAFDTIEVAYSTDVTLASQSSIRYGTPSSPANVNVRTLCQTDMARGVMLNIGVRHRQALCNFQLQSASLVYRFVNTRTPSHGAP